MQRSTQLPDRVASDQHVPEHLRSSRRRTGTPADEHEGQKHDLGLVGPEIEVDAGIAGRRQDRQRLEGGRPDGSVGARAPQYQRQHPGRRDDNRRVRPKLVVPEQRLGTPEQGTILQREVGPGQEHEPADDPLDGGTVEGHHRLGVRREASRGQCRHRVAESIVERHASRH